MPNSLLTGVSGLISHQRLLDVVGHNIANMNTHGFKAQRIVFADLLYETIRPAASSNDGATGGTNPNQVGGGVKVGQVDRRFSQGALESTGEQFDFALSGGGFFTVTDGVEDFYTRAGSFSLDEQNYLVAPGGKHVKRFSSAGEPDGINPGFQISGDPRIKIPLGAPIEGVITNEVSVTGNLSAKAETAESQINEMSQPFQVSGADAPATALLNDLESTTNPYVVGNTISIEATQSDGTRVFQDLPVDGTTTVQDLVNALDALVTDATATYAAGKITLTADAEGVSSLNFSFRNPVANAGNGIYFQDHQIVNAQLGRDAGTTTSLVTVYDEQGGAHEIELTFEKATDDSWVMNAAMDPDTGVLVDSQIDNINFDDSGRLLSTGSPTITMQVNGIAIPQTITFDFGDPNSAERLTHFNADSSLSSGSDGAAPGTVTGMQVDANGTVKGIASNGKVFTLAQLAVASFSNEKGLVAVADNLYVQSLNSGQPEPGAAGAGGRGIVRGGQLESSNVDVATEFTKLIVAQRGYSANARTITISSEVLEELTNIIR